MIRSNVIGSVRIKDVVKKTGTPVCIYDKDAIIHRMKEFKENFRSHMFETRVLYASKAFLCREMVKLATNEGLGLDIVSGGELHCAARGQMPGKRIYFHGNNKGVAEIDEAFRYGVGTIVVDNENELEELGKLQEESDHITGVIIRVNPGIEAHTHEYIATAKKDSKFGISIDDRNTVMRIIEKIGDCSNLEFRGFHAHIGSQIFSHDAFMGEIDTMIQYIVEMEEICGVKIGELNLGGGFAVRYTDEDAPLPIGPLCREIIKTCERKVMQLGLHLKRLTIEPGRSIVAEAGITVYCVGYSKKTESKEYIFIDGGMADNIRPVLYQAAYSCENISKFADDKLKEYTVAGKCCESGDVIIKSAFLPETERGDLLAVYSTGAYGYSMASNYNKLGRPPVVFASQGNARLIIEGETYEDMARLETDKVII